jgi:hypothetical protein
VGAQVRGGPAGRVGAHDAMDVRGAQRLIQYRFEVRAVLGVEAGRIGHKVSLSVAVSDVGTERI